MRFLSPFTGQHLKPAKHSTKLCQHDLSSTLPILLHIAHSRLP